MKQYGIRLRTVELEYTEFLGLLSCLMSDTPLGQVIAVRSEKDVDIINGFSESQKRIRKEWRERRRKQESEQEYKSSMDALFDFAMK